MNTLDLAGRHIAVTGGFGALGLATAAVLAGRGARVALLDRASATDGTPAAGVLGGVDLADVAGGFAFLLSADAQPVTGACLPVTGHV